MSAPTLAAAEPADTSLKDDLLTGVAAIAEFTGDFEVGSETVFKKPTKPLSAAS